MASVDTSDGLVVGRPAARTGGLRAGALFWGALASALAIALMMFTPAHEKRAPAERGTVEVAAE
jgi:hypothetical protein